MMAMTSYGERAEGLVLEVPSFDPAAERIAATPGSARALVTLRPAQEAMKTARAEAEEAAEGRAVAEALHACRLLSSRELEEAEIVDEKARARLFDAEFFLALATMSAFAATKHVRRIAIRAFD